MDREYYILALNNNSFSDPMKIDNIIYKGEVYDLPEVMEEAIKYSVYEPLEILAVKSKFSNSLRDVITGEVIVSSSDGNVNGLSYFKSVVASRSDIIRITKKYECMSDEDIKRYKKSILDIKDKSIKLYIEKQNRLINELHEEEYARDFLIRFQEWNA